MTFGWPTTFEERIEVRSSTGSTIGLRDLMFTEFFGRSVILP
jgi:hypothetical protein